MDSIPAAAWLITLVAMVIMGLCNRFVFERKGLSGTLGFVLGFFFGVLPLLVVMFFPNKSQ